MESGKDDKIKEDRKWDKINWQRKRRNKISDRKIRLLSECYFNLGFD